jgi:hypothetical protein
MIPSSNHETYTHTRILYVCVCLKNSLVETTQKYFLKLKSTRIGFFPLVRHGHSAPSPHHLHALAGTTAPHLSAPDTAAAGRCCPPATPHLAIHEPRQTLQIFTIFFLKKRYKSMVRAVLAEPLWEKNSIYVNPFLVKSCETVELCNSSYRHVGERSRRI